MSVKEKLLKNMYFRAVYRACAYWHLFFFKSVIYITILNHRYNSQQYALDVCAQIVDCLYKYTIFQAKKIEICPIRPIPNVILLSQLRSSIVLMTCEWNVCASTVRDWTIEFIQFNFSIAHRWRKDGCQWVYKLGLDQLSRELLVFGLKKILT